MPLSTMQEILILLEDEKKVPLFRINRWGRASKGALAKLKSFGYIEKQKLNNEEYYLITNDGEKYFDSMLRVLKEKNAWDNKWRLVMFNIPESKRAVRDKLRRELSDLGMGLLQPSVWITALDVKEEIEKFQKSMKLGTNLKYFEVSSNQSLDNQVITKVWDLPDINLEYERFVKEAERSLKNMGKGNGDRFNAKKLIYLYSLILKSDPRLPQEFTTKNPLRARAREIYQQLRRFVV